MLRRYGLSVLVCVGLLFLFCTTCVEAGDGPLARLLRGPHARAPQYLGNPQPMTVAPPTRHVYPEHNVNGPWYGYGFGVPTYPWGYFGAKPRPAVISHHGYHGEFTQWGYRQGY